MNRRLRDRIILPLLIIVLSFLMVIGVSAKYPINAQPIRTTEINNLNNRIRQLESEVHRLQRSNRTPSPATTGSSGSLSPQVIDGELVGRSDPLTERLATLLIELKEQVRALEQRVTQLENN